MTIFHILSKYLNIRPIYEIHEYIILVGLRESGSRDLFISSVIICIVFYCIVLMEWSLLPNALRPFIIYWAPPSLGIRTWICRLNFAQRPFFQAWGSLMCLKSQTREPKLKVPPGGLVLRIFTSWKNPSTSAGFEPANLGSRGEHVTLKPPRPTVRSFKI